MLVYILGGVNVLRVLIVENHLLLGAALQQLLSEESDLDVIGISPHTQLELVQAIRRIHPDVVFLDEDNHLTDAIDLLAFLRNIPELRVIVVSTNHDVVHIFNKRETLLHHATDLFDIIRHKSFLDQTS